MDSIDVNLENEIKELYNNLITKVNIEINKINPEQYSNGPIIFINKFINIYINLKSFKKHKIWRKINFLNNNLRKASLNIDYKYKTTNNENIKKIFLLFYLMIFRHQILLNENNRLDYSQKFLYVKNLYNLLKILSAIISKFYSDNIIDIDELGIILKMLIIFSLNKTYKNIKGNSDIVNLMYFKECLDIIYLIFNEKANETEQKFLIEIFTYINNNICFRDKNNTTLNYTNKLYMLHNDYKTTKLIKMMNFFHKINNKDLTTVYFELLSNIYYFQFSYNNLTWKLFELLEPLLANIKEKNYETLLNEVSFPEFQFDFMKYLMKKERLFIKDNVFIFKNAFYFSGHQTNSGLIADIGKIRDHFLLMFGFNLILSDVQKDEYIIFQIKNYEQKVQLKTSVLKINEDYFLCIIDSRLNQNGNCFKIQINPHHYYSFAMTVEKGKNINLSFISDGEYSFQKFKIKEIKTSNILLCVGCEIEKIDLKSNSIHKNYKLINSFTGFIGDIFIINMHGYKEKFCLQKNILNLKGKYGYTLVKSLWDQRSLDEYITSNLENTSKASDIKDEEPSIFKNRYSENKKYKIYKIIDNIEVFVNSSNFRLIDYLDNIDYMNYDNKYSQRMDLYINAKKENQFFNNMRTKESINDNKVIIMGSSLFSCHFNVIENTSSLLKFVEEDGIFYLLLIFEYYYQILFRICKDVLINENNDNIILSHEQNEILKIIEKGIEDNVEFFLKKIIETNFNVKSYKLILFYYQMNVVIKQFVLLKNINNNIYNLLFNFLERYQKLLNEYFKTNFDEEKTFYKNIRNFFLDFLLNPAFYRQTEKFDLLTNLTNFIDLLYKVVQDNIFNEEILTKNIFDKIFSFVFIFSEQKENTSSPNFKTLKSKYLFLLINYYESIYLESKQNRNIIDIFHNHLFKYEKDPFIFYYLSLALFISNVEPILKDDYLNKLMKIFEDNYLLKEIKNQIFAISSMLLLSSHYLIFKLNDGEKIKFFKAWLSKLSQKISFVYFENIYNLIFGGILELNEILVVAKDYYERMENEEDCDCDSNNQKKFFEKKERNLSSSVNINLLIHKNMFVPLATNAGYTDIKKKQIKNDTEEIEGEGDNDLKDMAKPNIEELKKQQQRKDTTSKKSLKINIKVNIEENEKEIEKIKTQMNQEKYYNTYYCTLDDVKKRCFMYNPKNILIKRFFSHIFYRSLFYCKAFMIIKNRYINSFPTANIENKQLNYPSKIKNFSNILEPKLFLKKDFNIYNTKYFPISHDFLTKIPPGYEEIDPQKQSNSKALLKANVFDINFYPHRFNVSDVFEEKDRYFDCELVTQQFTYFGYLILGDKYLYYGTKNEEPINLRDKNLEEIDINYISKYSFSYRDKDNKTTRKKSIILFYYDIQRIIKRRSFLIYQSFEVYCQNGKSYFFNLYRKENCDNAFKILGAIRDNLLDKDKFEFVNESTSEEAKKITSEVKNGTINNFIYLLKLNYLSGRTYNDLNQYPVFPWLFFDISKIDALLNCEKSNIGAIKTITELPMNSEQQETENTEIEKIELEKIDSKNLESSNKELCEKLQLRNFIYPISMQTADKRETYIQNNYSPYGTHYSTASYIFYYLIRTYPFNETMIQLQNYNKESPNRLLTSLEESLYLLYENIENREPCPEFFSRFDFYCNLNCAFFGLQHNGDLVDDLRVNQGTDISGNLYPIYFKYEYLFRKFLNSFLVSKYLPNWIDFIFGVKQIEKSPTSFYIFNKISYEEKTKLDKKLLKYIKRNQNDEEFTNKDIRKKINIKIDFLNNFGIVPHKVLNSSIKLKTSAKIKNLSDEILEIYKNYYFIKSNDNVLILYKNPKDTDKMKKILFWNYNKNKNEKIFDKKNIYNCGYLKQLQKININNVNNIEMKIPIYKPCYSMCKFIMFNKTFIVTCRYLGNIFKVQNSDYYIEVFCEDFVSSITCKKALDSSLIEDVIIYTGMRNGKLIEWKINHSLNDYGKINVKERNSHHCHQGEITCIEIYLNQHIIITGGEDKMIFIRKTQDFEILSVINLTYCYMNPIISQKTNIVPTMIKVSDLNCFYVLLYNFDSGKSFIRGYNFNGLFFKQSEEDYYMNICFTKNYNLLVSYYNKNKIDVFYCYDLKYTNFSINLKNFEENIEKNFNKNKKKKNENIGNNILVWNDYDYNNHELILLYDNKIVRGNIKDKEEQMNLEFY